jgi:hypothetical protein
VVPCLIVLAKNDHVDLHTTDIGEMFERALKIVAAGEIVAKCRSHHNADFKINADGTLTLVVIPEKRIEL